MAWFYGIVIIACYVAGASVIMWLAERINERGIGNGISMILFANIVSSLPSLFIGLGKLVVSTYKYGSEAKSYIEEGLEYTKATWAYGVVSTLFALLMVAMLVALTIFVIFITGSERRVPVQYAKRVVGRKMYGGQSSNIPLKLNMTGVMPIIFASSIVSLLPTILMLCGVTAETAGFWGGVYRVFGSEGVVYPVLLFLFIIGFAYFYTQITFDPMEVANNLKKQGGAIPGIRQGRPTADYIKKILNKVTIVGALFLGIIAVLPVISGPHLIRPLIEWLVGGAPSSVWAEANITNYSDWVSYYYASMIQQNNATTISSLTSSFTFGGTSLLIVVGVAIETFRELEAQLTMRNYKGFL
jgi:preprotein translocase subunit SecY